jgi:catechol 2,3-dioxygenase-like lactoylglutathione lyase family enzyme
VQLNGVAHIQLSVSDLRLARAFWQPFFALFEMKILIDSEVFYYAIGSRTGIALSPIDPTHRGDRFDQRRIGLHHLCLRARERGDVDVVHALAVKQGATIVPRRGRTASRRAITRSSSRTRTASGSK